MLPVERRNYIREQVIKKSTVTAQELSTELGVALITIRRDLVVLEQEGILVRSHGGAVSKRSGIDFQQPHQVLKYLNSEEKLAIATAAKSLVFDGEIVFFEASTTVFELAGLLSKHAHLTAVTNSPLILNKLAECSAMTLMSTGGELHKDVHYLCGSWTRDVLSRTRLDKAILGISAIDPAYGVSCTRPAHAEVKKLLSTVARTRIGLVDHTKFGKESFSFVGPVTDFDIIVTSNLTTKEHIEALRSAGVQVIIAEVSTSEVE